MMRNPHRSIYQVLATDHVKEKAYETLSLVIKFLPYQPFALNTLGAAIYKSRSLWLPVPQPSSGVGIANLGPGFGLPASCRTGGG